MDGKRAAFAGANGHLQVAVMCVQREMPALVRCSVCQGGEMVSTAEIEIFVVRETFQMRVWRGAGRGVGCTARVRYMPVRTLQLWAIRCAALKRWLTRLA